MNKEPSEIHLSCHRNLQSSRNFKVNWDFTNCIRRHQPLKLFVVSLTLFPVLQTLHTRSHTHLIADNQLHSWLHSRIEGELSADTHASSELKSWRKRKDNLLYHTCVAKNMTVDPYKAKRYQCSKFTQPVSDLKGTYIRDHRHVRSPGICPILIGCWPR